MIATYSGASERRLDRWLATYAADLEPLGDDARALLRQRLRARRRASVPALVLVMPAVGLLLSTLPGLWTEDVETWGREWSIRYLVALAVIEGVFLLRQHLERRAEARIAAGLTARVARSEHVPPVAILGRVAMAAGAVSAVAGVGWAAVLLVLYPGGMMVAWAVCIGLAVVTSALGVGRAIGRPAVAVDAASLAIDERLRVEEASTAMLPLWMVWLALSPSGLALPGASRWAAKGLAFTTLVVMVLTTWAMLQRVSNRPRPVTRR